MVLAVLCADQATIGRSTIAAPRRDRPLTDNVGRFLTEQGIQTTPKTFDAGHYGSYTEIEAVNPALPARGRVLIADDGMLRWECSLDVPTEIQGIDLPEIASTISKVLVVDGEPESPRVKTRNRPEHRRCIRHL